MPGAQVQLAWPDAAPACVDVRAQLDQQLEAGDAWQRLSAVRDFIGEAIGQSGHAMHEIPASVFADPPALLDASTVSHSPIPEATPLMLSEASALDAILERLDRIDERLADALGAITEKQAGDLRRLLPALFRNTVSGSDLGQPGHGSALTEITARIDFHALESAAALLAGLAAPEIKAALIEEFSNRSIAKPPAWLADQVTGAIVHAEQTRHGAIIVGGPGPNLYTGPAALIIDTGGDDVYAQPPDVGRLRVILELGGNDSYTGKNGSVLTAGLIVDHAGDDIWSGNNITQGAAVAGIGMLYDHAGNDRYTGGELVQGASLAGLGALIDDAGDDQYTAARFAQGFGGANGIGLLSDRSGNDAYIAGNRHPSSYGVAGNFQAFSQGVGMGFRDDIAGGTGLLHDRLGNDRYLAANFSQGTGYYLGAGILLDEAGNDAYSGGRFAQGTAAHMAVGLLRDEAGDDTYSGSPSANQGASWDQAIAALVDCTGDDRYSANEFAQGAAAQSAVALFFDATGDNEFSARRKTRGHSGPTDYHEGGDRIGNLALFITEYASTNATCFSLPNGATPNAPSAASGPPAQTRMSIADGADHVAADECIRVDR